MADLAAYCDLLVATAQIHGPNFYDIKPTTKKRFRCDWCEAPHSGQVCRYCRTEY